MGAALGRCIENDLTVHISNRNGPFLQTMASDFAVKRAAANFETLSSLMFVPVGFLKHTKNQLPLIFSQGDRERFGN